MGMTTKDLEDKMAALEAAPKGVSFAGQALKLNTVQDAEPVAAAINNAKVVEYLNLEGNSLGYEAAEQIGAALSKRPEFKKALFKDMFTGRKKDEIPLALAALSYGFSRAGARLVELDLSDNAFGPIGIEGLKNLLCSTVCFDLQILQLNNNGLGIGGAKILSEALLECMGQIDPVRKELMPLRVFIAGRNRLENDGAIAISKVFKRLRTLEVVKLPQNGIYHEGISAIADGLILNSNLAILNLNDNTIGPEGMKGICAALPSLQQLKVLDLGDCLIRTKGACLLAKTLTSHHLSLEELILDSNEIGRAGGMVIVNAMGNKSKLRRLSMNGNIFGQMGVEEITDRMKGMGKLSALAPMDDNESDEENDSIDSCKEVAVQTISSQEFLANPTVSKLVKLGQCRAAIIGCETMQSGKIRLHECLVNIMKVSELTADSTDNTAQHTVSQLYELLFAWGVRNDQANIINNAIFYHLDLLKSEDKLKPTWDLELCRKAFEIVLKEPFVPQEVVAMYQALIKRQQEH